MKKKVISSLLVCALLFTMVASAFAAGSKNVSWLVSLNKESVTNETDQTVVLTLAPDNAVTLDAFDYVINYHGAPLTIEGISCEDQRITLESDDINKTYSDTQAKVLFGGATDSENLTEVTSIGSVVFTVPAGTPAGQYTFYASEINVSENYGAPWASKEQSNSVILTVSDVPEEIIYEVTLPSDAYGEASVISGADYTFYVSGAHYDYSFAATMGNDTADIVDNQDGSYTVQNVSGDISVTLVQKTAKSYPVTMTGEGVLTDGASAVYLQDYHFSCENDSGSACEVTITIGGASFTEYTVSDNVYTVPGVNITGPIEITINKPVAPDDPEDSVAYYWAEDNSTCTAARANTEDPSQVETAEAVVSVVSEPAGCEQTGRVTYTAVFAVDWAEQQTKTETLAALGHSYGETVYEWSDDNASCTAVRVCSRDVSHMENAAGSVSIISSTAEKCGDRGTVTYTAVFAESWTTQQTRNVETSALEHSWAAPAYEWSDDNTVCTAKRVCSRDESHVETAEAVITDEITLEPCCGAEGERTFTAVFAEDWAARQTTTEKLEKTEHIWNSPEYEWNGDYTECTAVRSCKNDSSHVETAASVSVSSRTTAPDCVNTGSVTYTAKFNEEWCYSCAETVIIPAVGHTWDKPDVCWTSDHTSCTITRVCLADVSHIETAVASDVTSVTEPAKCENSGSITFTASFAESWASPETEVETIPASGHKWVYSGELSDISKNVFVCVHDSNHVRTEPLPTPKATLVETDCGAEKTIYINGGEDSVTLTALVLPENAEQSVRWTGMNSDYGRFVQNGNAITISDFSKTGKLLLTATANDGSGKKSTVKLTFARYAENLDIRDAKSGSITEWSINGGREYTFKAVLSSEGYITDKTVLWSLSDTQYAAVSNGRVTVKAFAGEDKQVTLTATAASNPEATDSITLRLVPNLTKGIDILTDDTVVSNTTLIKDINDRSMTLSAVAEALEGDVSWKSSDNSVAVFPDSSNGTVFFVKPGSVTLTATCDGVSSSVRLTIRRFTESITVSGNTELTSGKSTLLKASVTPEDATIKTLTWSLAKGDEAYATISGGFLTARKSLASPVTVTVVVTANDGHAPAAEYPVEIKPMATGVSITGPTGNTVDLRTEGLQLEAVVEPMSAAQDVKWTSSNSNFKIDQDTGLITIQSGAGATSVTFTATAKDGSGKKASVKLSFANYMRDEDLSFENVSLASGRSMTVRARVSGSVTNRKISYRLESNRYATYSSTNVLKAKAGITEPVIVRLIASARDGSGVEKTCYVTIYPITTRLNIHRYDDGTRVTGKTIDFDGSLKLRIDANPSTCAKSWKVKCSNSALDTSLDGNILTVSVKNGRSLNKGTKITLTVTADDGSGKYAKVILKKQ